MISVTSTGAQSQVFLASADFNVGSIPATSEYFPQRQLSAFEDVPCCIDPL